MHEKGPLKLPRVYNHLSGISWWHPYTQCRTLLVPILFLCVKHTSLRYHARILPIYSSLLHFFTRSHYWRNMVSIHEDYKALWQDFNEGLNNEVDEPHQKRTFLPLKISLWVITFTAVVLLAISLVTNLAFALQIISPLSHQPECRSRYGVCNFAKLIIEPMF